MQEICSQMCAFSKIEWTLLGVILGVVLVFVGAWIFTFGRDEKSDLLTLREKIDRDLRNLEAKQLRQQR